MELLLADDHSMIRKGLSILCQKEFGIRHVDEVSSCSDLMKALRKKKYTHAIVDLVLSDGVTLEVLPNIKHLYPHLNILVFSMQPSGMYRSGLARFGITNFISKAAPERETFGQLRAFLDSNGIGHIGDPSPAPAFAKLTPRETEVLHYLLLGLGSAEIGNILNMKQNTISTFKKRILAKSNARNVLELKEMAAIQKDVFDLF